MKTRTIATALTMLSLLLVLRTGLPAVAQGPGAGPAKLGKVNFPVSCNAAAQKEFEMAMAYYHSFAWLRSMVCCGTFRPTEELT